MTATNRPDLSSLAPDVVAYIEALEEKLAALEASPSRSVRSEATLEPSEPPTPINIVTISRSGLIKRTPRHLYGRQRRGGMGVFDMELSDDDAPAFLLAVHESSGLILVTDRARAFRIPLSALDSSPVRARGVPITDHVDLRDDEAIRLVFPQSGGSFLVLVSERGQARRISSNLLGDALQPGTVLFNVNDVGVPAAACWSTGANDLFIATAGGRAIRFAERQVPVRGCLGLRVDRDDRVIGVASTSESGGVFLLNAEGKGTVRLMSGFNANKAPGAGGKVAMKTDALIGAVAVEVSNGEASEGTDIFAISRLGKLIRFAINEVPAKEGVVQGVNCMGLRADECTAVAAS